MIIIPNNCTGCTACVEVCPLKIISMEPSDEGFLYPQIDLKLCKNCELCERVCPSLNMKRKQRPHLLFVGQNKDESILRESSSGGVFSAIAQVVLARRGVIYGAAIDYKNGYRVKHIRLTDAGELRRLRGSKYVQSDMRGIMPQVKEDLEHGRDVLFSGTPCQVSGLKNYLGKPYAHLLLVDLVCHGVPSPRVWEKYILEESKNLARKGDENSVSPIPFDVKSESSKKELDLALKEDVLFKAISFRDKRNGWQKYGFALFPEPTGEGKNTVSLFYNRYEHPYMRGFLADLFLRPSCHSCPVKGFSSGSDITIADAWGIENYDVKSGVIDKGISMVIPHTDRGEQLVRGLDLYCQEVTEDILTIHNPAAHRSCSPHKNHRKFFNLIANGASVAEAVSVCLPPPSYTDKIIWSIKRRLKQVWK